MLAPYHDRDGFIWMNGEFLPWRDAKIHLLTHSLHYGSCVFEGERAYNGRIFESEFHSKRLLNSAQALGFKIPYTVEELECAKAETLKKQGLSNAYVRAMSWRGSETVGISAQNNTIHTAIIMWEWGAYYGDAKDKGAIMDISTWRRPSPQTIPCKAKAAGLYMICSLSKHAAEDKGCTDAIMLDYRGYIAEATGANVFFVRDGVVYTPTPDCFLDGITRQTAIKLLKMRGIEVVERFILPEEIPSFQQCFLTGTAAEITPVSKIGSHCFEIADLTRTVMDDYYKLCVAVDPDNFHI
jgi:branched-chain amino acid aminotransferase